MGRALIATKSSWKLDNLPASILADDRVRVRICLAGLCRTDIQAMMGQRQVAQGRVLGHEAAGKIENIPSALRGRALDAGLQEGDRVAFFPFLPCGKCPDCLTHSDLGYCTHAQAVGLDVDGAFADTIDLPLETLVKAPDGLTWKHLAYSEPVAAALGVWQVEAVHDAKRIGVIGRGRIAELTRRVLHMEHKSVALIDPDDEILPNYYDVIVETWPEMEALTKAVSSLRPGGTLVVKSRPAEPVLWPHQLLTMRRIKCEGVPYGSFHMGLDLLNRGDIQVDDMLGAAYPFTTEGVSKALKDEQQGMETQGKLFFEINPCVD